MGPGVWGGAAWGGEGGGEDATVGFENELQEVRGLLENCQLAF